MKITEHLKRQTEDAYEWTNRLIESIPTEKWDEIPENIETNVTWQIGHLIMSFYYHSIMVIKGHQIDVIKKIPLQEYNKLFTNAKPINSVGKTNPTDLVSQLKIVQKKSLEIIESLSVYDLENPLEPTEMPHPTAKNKYEALDWNIKHAMWHCGQLGILKRIVDERYDFGLKTNE
ncbi:DinB family protein [Kriegella aquimaris]|uniref:DinB superfamily protein n=1 Tax=Kriegella aquimaris TaxID=192904 RepID=A0A1G9JK45_9FLAO|nr:DinB family protein [Kriegella aquimaris]SDL37889.1 DinB superfamily protein [Kriegella aquimaris]